MTNQELLAKIAKAFQSAFEISDAQKPWSPNERIVLGLLIGEIAFQLREMEGFDYKAFEINCGFDQDAHNACCDEQRQRADAATPQVA